jgi:hypothetical protein
MALLLAGVEEKVKRPRAKGKITRRKSKSKNQKKKPNAKGKIRIQNRKKKGAAPRAPRFFLRCCVLATSIP